VSFGGWGPTRLDSLTACPFNFETPARLHPGIKFILAHFGGAATYLQTVVLISRMPNVFADTAPGWGVWVFRNRMGGLDEVDFGKVLYGTDTVGDGYTTNEAWWIETLMSMGRTQEELEMYFYKNGAELLGID
jgi:predicted TIM-barrel fold metal-dependent hydrolase